MMRIPQFMTLLAAALFAACQGPAMNSAGTGATPGSGDGRIYGPANPGELAVNPNDPCVTNLGALVENLIVYYSVKNHLPASLNEISMTSVSGQKISLTCPQTGNPYVYVPQGIHPPYDVMPNGAILVLYDKDPVHPIVKHIGVGNQEFDLKQIVRYGIVFKPTKPGEPVSMHVAPIEDSLLKMYLDAPQPKANAPR